MFFSQKFTGVGYTGESELTGAGYTGESGLTGVGYTGDSRLPGVACASESLVQPSSPATMPLKEQFLKKVDFECQVLVTGKRILYKNFI